MNLYSSEDFFNFDESRTDENFVTEKYHFIDKEFMKDQGGHGMTRLVPLKLQERIQNYHPVPVPSLKIPDYFRQFVDGELRFKIAHEVRELR